MFVCITLGTGVGGGIIDRGSVVRGARNYAGEVGHMTIDERGPRCKCGNRGCLEAFVGADALVRDARHTLKRSGSSGPLRAARSRLTPELIARAAREGDRGARAVFDRAGEHLGTAVASLINLLNPDTIGLAGGVAGGFDLMQKRLRGVVAERAFRESARAVTIARGRLGVSAAAVGAALMAREALRTHSAGSVR
jgi:glucokinase